MIDSLIQSTLPHTVSASSVLKPGNVMLIPDPEQLEGVRTKLLDFGIARFLDSPNRRTAAGTVMGTPPYMSPEQCMGQEVDAKTDVYALGIMMYEMLVGQPPFYENNMTNILVAHVNQAPKPLREHVPSTPQSLHSLIDQMLAKSSSERPTMVQIVTQLRAIEQELRRASAATMVSPGSGPIKAEPDDATRMMAEPKSAAQAPTRIYPAQPAVSRRTQLILFAAMGLLTLVALFWILRPVFQ